MKYTIALLALSFGVFLSPVSQANDFVTTDNRVKTLVYNENDVFTLVTTYGYQSSIEFGRNEDILTVSVGDRTAWQIVPSGTRLFIRAMEYNAQTNMTVITSKRTYLFDLQSVQINSQNKSQISYILRFFYPDEQPAAPSLYDVSSADLLSGVVVEPADANYHYTYTGNDALAPVKIFDDGQSTYFRLRPGAQPAVMIVHPDGSEKPVPTSRRGEYMVVPIVASRFTLRYGAEPICIYNEQRAY